MTTTSSPARANDGVLVLGVLLPTTGPGATLFGEGMVDAVHLATEQINDAGGVIGSEVTLIEADEGATAASAAIGLDSLITGGVDAIIGPASSIVALSDLDVPVVGRHPDLLAHRHRAGARRLPRRRACSSARSRAIRCRWLPSPTSPSAPVRPRSRSAISTIPTVAASPQALKSAVGPRGLSVLAEVAFSGDDEQLADEADDLLADSPSVVAILGDAGDGTRLLDAVAQAMGRRRTTHHRRERRAPRRAIAAGDPGSRRQRSASRSGVSHRWRSRRTISR